MTGANNSSMSSATTKSRPWMSARARAIRSSARLPRTEAPTSTAAIVRVARTSSTAQRAQQRIDVDVLDGLEQTPEPGEVGDRAEQIERVPVELRVDDRELVVERRVAERGADHEAVELGFGEHERPGLLDRVLGRDHEERVGERVGEPVDRDLVLGHPLEERRLRLRQRPVDLVDDERRSRRSGPARNSKSRELGFHTESPVMSVGWRSGVHWIRATVAPSIEPANERASTVFAVPGTSSSSTCPLQANAARISSICSRLPWTTVPTFATRRDRHYRCVADLRVSLAVSRSRHPTGRISTTSQQTDRVYFRSACSQRVDRLNPL